MIPWVHLDTTKVPGGSEELRLWQRGAEFSIRLGRDELMNSRLSGSEEALATLVAARLGQRVGQRILIGGLGMGFTLRAAQTAFPADAAFIVAELVPAVVAWARGPMAPVFAGSLDDPRVTIREVDVAALIRNGGYDAILLDVDNGPEGLTRRSNDKLYGMEGLRLARAALRPRGILAVWSSMPDDAFEARLRKAGFSVEDERVKAHRGKSGARHIIWLATRT